MADESADSGDLKYLCLFAQEHVEFRISELLSIASMFSFKIHFHPKEHRKENPYLLINLPSEERARALLSRSVSIKSVYELWGCGSNLTEVKQTVIQYPTERKNAFSAPDSTYKINVETYNKKLSLAQHRELIDQLEFLPFQGRVNLSAPDHVFALLLDYGEDSNDAPSEPHRLFFGRLIGHGQRHLIKQYSLKTRHFIGNTSMDPQLSFLMANQGQVRPGTFVYDPFVGTGSVLISCSHFGAHVTGSDIDQNLLHGRGRSSRADRKGQWRARGENFQANFTQYGLERCLVDVMVADAGRLGLREVPLFDAIVTDPPYGIREGARKLEISDVEPQGGGESRDETLFSPIRGCRLSEILTTLLDVAARYLVLHGRLVYWLPIYRPSYSEALIPSHPCLKMTANSEQRLSRNVSRRLITMEKVKAHEIGGPNLSVVDQKFLDSCDNFRDNYFSQTAST